MAEFVKGECPHCGQSIEYPSEGTGQTVPCPTCEKTFVLQPLPPPATAPPIYAMPPADQPRPSSLKPKLPAAQSARPSAPFSPPQKALVPPAQISAPPAVSTEPVVSKPPGPAAPAASPFERACLEFERAGKFGGRSPTREQVGRAWALVKFRKGEGEPPTHAELVAALKEIFKEFRTPRPASGAPSANKPG